MDQDEKQSRTDRPSTEPVTWLAAISVTAGLVAIAAQGTLAKFLAIPLAISVAWALVLVSQRQRRRLDPLGRDRKLAAAAGLALLLGTGVIASSLSASESTTMVLAPGDAPSSGGRAAGPEATAKSLGGYSPSNRPTYECTLHSGTCEAGVDHIVFNSYINAVNYGDERSFVDAKPAGDQSKDGYHDRLSVNPGDKITLRIYIDNNADTLPAHGTKLTVLLAKNRARRILAVGSISAADAQPGAVNDTVEFDSAEPISLQFDRAQRPQVTYRQAPSQQFKTRDLPSAFFADQSIMTARLGIWPPGFAASALITTTVLVT
jgi:hypothetical protein